MCVFVGDESGRFGTVPFGLVDRESFQGLRGKVLDVFSVGKMCNPQPPPRWKTRDGIL